MNNKTKGALMVLSSVTLLLGTLYSWKGWEAIRVFVVELCLPFGLGIIVAGLFVAGFALFFNPMIGETDEERNV